ncbi:MAG: hypothetical protein V1707_03050 [bacterium]
MKDFFSWHEEKEKLEEIGYDTLLFREGEVWWCSIGLNLGHEQDGKNVFFERPVLVVKKFNKIGALSGLLGWPFGRCIFKIEQSC